MNLILEKKLSKKVKKPLLTKKDWASYSADKKELESLQDAYLSTFDHAKKQKE